LGKKIISALTELYSPRLTPELRDNFEKEEIVKFYLDELVEKRYAERYAERKAEVIKAVEIAREVGEEKGRKKGREEKKDEIALNLIHMGITRETILKATGITEERLKTLEEKTSN
jgi:predicted transposase/invertase (TIGR01784 family)